MKAFIVSTYTKCIAGFIVLVFSLNPVFSSDIIDCQKQKGSAGVQSCTRLIKMLKSGEETINTQKLAEFYYYRAGTHQKELHDKLAITDYTQAIELNPRLREAYYSRGISFYYLKQYKRAIVDFNIVISMSRLNPSGYIEKVTAFMRLKDFSSAKTVSAKAIKRLINKIDIAEAYNLYGYAYLRSGDFVNGLKNIKQAISILPDELNYQHSLGDAYYYSGNHEKANKAWKALCKKITPGKAPVWHKPLAELGYYVGEIKVACNAKTLKAFELCAKAKCSI